ncbi:MAG TPA: carboxylating nicotinate-nucleotide diphosphorylase [Chryseosolibacter sp.]|nr:carboxylating nicotinate-nucleotide diphosphorylase [Chryseosolibacter sp.]
MRPPYITDDFLQTFIRRALEEDVGDGDHSSLACIPAGTLRTANLLIKDNGILAGVELAQNIFHSFDKEIKLTPLLRDGDKIAFGDIAFTVSGPARSILQLERLVLNCMQRMSAIASLTRQFVSLVAGTGAAILDTRKTTPNFRLLEKWAVLIGGGVNHRLGLYDMIMLKDNHIDMAGGISTAINRTKDYLRATGKKLPIDIETRNLDEVREVLATGGVDIIMLDNMTLDEMREAVKLIAGRFKTEASGGVTADTIRGIAECGVDYVSVGSLTHGVKNLDMSLKAVSGK